MVFFIPKFFSDNITGSNIIISGEDAIHLIRALRVSRGENITVCDMKGNDYHCRVESVDRNEVIAEIISAEPCLAEPKRKITLFQALPKGDKMELIVQKSVELGVCEIVPVFTHRCISRPDGASLEKKIARWQKIAAEAAKQSGRGIIPLIKPAIVFQQAIEQMKLFKTSILFYEQATVPLKGLLEGHGATAILTGPEGGFEAEEIVTATDAGINICTLGPRILRCETAPLAALSIILASEVLI